jgi:glycosyltransferase involved in cell wall biosynthesis
MPSSNPSIAVVIPVRDARELLPACLASITDQLTAADQLIVVDDGSVDGSDRLAAEFGATVVRHERPRGPYAARNAGWQCTDRDIVVFTDSRCRARRTWLNTIREACAHDGVALACSDIEILDGDTRAAKVMHRRQTFRAYHTNGARFFLPFFPTGNLAVRRSALEAVDGFEEIRSGGDADLCWRIQLAELGAFVAVDQITMDYVPRASAKDLLGQWARYGRSQAHLRMRYQRYGLDSRPPTVWRRVEGTIRVIAVDLIRHRSPVSIAVLDGLATWVHNQYLARELRTRRRVTRVSGNRVPA